MHAHAEVRRQRLVQPVAMKKATVASLSLRPCGLARPRPASDGESGVNNAIYAEGIERVVRCPVG